MIENIEQTPQLEQVNSAVDNSFFYTNDKFINSMDNNEIIDSLVEKYPLLGANHTDSEYKKSLLSLFENEEFVEQQLSFFKITIDDLCKVLYSNYGPLFKGVFLKKFKKVFFSHKYAKYRYAN